MITWLAGPEEANNQAWIDYLKAVRDDLNLSWEEAKSAYLTLRRVREMLGMPFMSGGGEGPKGSPDAWSPQLEQLIIDTQAFVTFMNTWADQAIAGERKIAYDPGKGLYLELLPTDKEKIVEDANQMVSLVDATTGDPIDITGTVGVAPAVAWAAVAGTAVIAVASYFTVKVACETLESMAEQKTMRTIADKQAALVAAGQATPEQAQKMTDAIYDGAKELTRAKAEVKKEDAQSGLSSTIVTVGYIALGVAGIYLLSRVIPPMLEAR